MQSGIAHARSAAWGVHKRDGRLYRIYFLSVDRYVMGRRSEWVKKKEDWCALGVMEIILEKIPYERLRILELLDSSHHNHIFFRWNCGDAGGNRVYCWCYRRRG